MKNYDTKLEFFEIIEDILDNDLVNQMKNYKQHYDVTTYDHCLNVAYLSYSFCKKHNLDYVSMARAAMMHDLFLYDWRNHGQYKLFEKHAFTHGKTALENARKVCKLNSKEEDIIYNHMWPVTWRIPKYKETWVITYYDKKSTLQESCNYYLQNTKLGNVYNKACFISNMMKRINLGLI